MKNIFIYALISFSVVVSCNKTNKGKSTTESDNQNKSKTNELVDIFPKFSNTTSSNTIRKTSDSIVKKINATLSELKKEEKKITIYGTPNTPVTVWYSNSNVPVKIEHAVVNDSGVFNGKFEYYFIGGKLWYSNQIFARYIFDKNNLKYWLDENWKINDIPENNFKEREKTIKKNTNKLLQKNN
ncbi:hypothetical protein [Mesohalobacter halotolerans]|uniref:Uncharacterized protein n=1 Tax=Mesohalobacter halotolerans TaxID=1883405 RepID=A0A4U5TR32_9FLAO|nr:hypothetical protein [Mesohalobacter halotolerans]MBS3737988.1 hypothetical protein [Psychroflexus sp.]TKS56690.1 hypothetical protein FCN74_06575 [Mesohalobacter halotolerans]